MTEKRTSIFENGLIWFGAGVSLAEILTGTYFASLGFGKGLLAIIIGHIIGCTMLFLAGVIGGKTRRSAMETVKMSFGEKGGIFFSFLNVLQLVGWTAIMIYDGALAANGVLHTGSWVWCLVIGALIVLWIFIGITNLGKINTIAMAALFILTLVLCKLIFFDGGTALAIGEEATTKIARVLTEQQIPTPGTLEYRRTGSTRRYYPDYPYKWATNTIVHILERKEYLGHTVNFKTEKVSYKVKSSVENPEEKQVIFENTHEPIIDLATWERVQELRKQRKRPNRYDEVGLFSGLLFCADCGSVLYQQRYENKTRKQDCYICGNYKKRTHDCTAHFIRTDLLTAGVTANLRKVTSYAAKHEKQFMKLLIEQNEDGGKRRNAAKRKELDAAEKRIAELSAIFKRLYEDSVTGRISDERFAELSADYEAEQKQVKSRAAELQAELAKAQEATVNAEKFMKVVRKYTSFEELTHTLLREFIEKIVVHECSYDENGTRRQDIDIYYSFVGKVELPDE